MRRVPELDAIRGLAAILVVAHHYWMSLIPFGWIAVDLFFVLSGYLITSIILKDRDSDHFLRTFYVRRSLRIWPIYYLALLGLVLVNPLLRAPYPMDGLPYQLVYLQNIQRYWFAPPPPFNPYFSHSWTLAIEEQFYLIWPALVLVCGRRRLIPLTLASLALPVAARAWGYPETILLGRCDGLALGGLLAALLADPDWLRRHAGRFRLVVALAAPALLALLAWVMAGLGGTRALAAWPWARSLMFLAINLFFFTIVALIVDQAGRPVLRPLRHRWLCYLGQISYGIYLYHYLVLMVAVEAARRLGLREGRWMGLVCLPACLGVAALSWEFLERPLLALKDRFRYGRKPSRPTPAPDAVAEVALAIED